MRKMRFGRGVLGNVLRPLISLSSSRTIPTSQISSTLSFHASLQCTKPPQFLLPFFNHFHTLTDTRFPKRRPSDKPRRKRASLRPSGALHCIASLLFMFSNFNYLIYVDLFIQDLMLGLNTQLARPYFPISLMKGASRGGMRRNA